jgi:tRNA uridine 5-carbamoylmethylation protein Kti12
MKMSLLVMLIGVPGSGKSTFVNKMEGDKHVYSTDAYLESMATSLGKTYNQVFKDYIKLAVNVSNNLLDTAIKENKVVVWDQTNLTKGSRSGKLAKFPDHYMKIAVVFPIPDDLEARLASRPGKAIPNFIMKNMIDSFEDPTLDEGFTMIVDFEPPKESNRNV